jgi:hypothetical protein
MKVGSRTTDLCVSYQCTVERMLNRGGTKQQVGSIAHLLDDCQSPPSLHLGHDSINRGRNGYYVWPNTMGSFSPRVIQQNATT